MPEPDSALDDGFAAAIGRLTLTWASLELALDIWAHEIFHRFGGSGLEDALPRPLDRKIRFLKDAFRKLAPLAPERDRAIRLLDRVGGAADFRHDMIHGVAVGQIEGDPSMVPMLRLLREKTSLHAKRFAVSSEMVDQEAVKVARLSTGAWIMAEALCAHT